MKFNNSGWGIKEFIFILGLLTLCLILIVILYKNLQNYIDRNEIYESNQYTGTNNSSIKSYINIEDNMILAAKKYRIENTSDIVIIKLTKLIENKYIKTIKDPKNNKKCSGYIMYDGNLRDYKAYLCCPGNYQTSDYNKDFE